jgi:hypothetical protein
VTVNPPPPGGGAAPPRGGDTLILHLAKLGAAGAPAASLVTDPATPWLLRGQLEARLDLAMINDFFAVWSEDPAFPLAPRGRNGQHPTYR